MAKQLDSIECGGRQYSFELIWRKPLRGAEEECFGVAVIRHSDGKRWNGAIHLVSGATDKRAQSRVRSGLLAAFKSWKVDQIDGVFDIPTIILPESPNPHRCPWIHQQQALRAEGLTTTGRLKVPVLLRAEWRVGRSSVNQEAVSEWISAGFARLTIHDVRPASHILLENPANGKQRAGRVVRVEGPIGRLRRYEVDVDFGSPLPQFWDRVYFYSNEKLQILYVPESLIAGA